MLDKKHVNPLTIFAALLIGLGGRSFAAETAQSVSTNQLDPWKALRPLAGKWQGTVQGEPGSGTSEREYTFTLNNRFMHVTNRSVYPRQQKNPNGETHEDIAFISYDKSLKKFVLRQFHAEGFVNQYVLDQISDDRRTFSFTTTSIENIASGWRARESYRLVSDEEFVETFSLARPGSDFTTYSETRFRRKH
jgi:hypothetical protein